MRLIVVFLIGFFVLAGCKPDEADETDLCGASGLQDRVGQPISEFSFDGNTRVVRPNSPVTMDYQVDRLNVELDEDDIITRIACG